MNVVRVRKDARWIVEARRRLSRCGVVHSASYLDQCPGCLHNGAQPCGTSIASDEPCEGGLSFGRDVRMPLGGRPGGLGYFGLVGIALGHLVRARWDGVELSITE